VSLPSDRSRACGDLANGEPPGEMLAKRRKLMDWSGFALSGN